MKEKFVFIVISDDCNEGECDCTLESIDSVWFNEDKANDRAKEVYHGHVQKEVIKDSQFTSVI